MEVIYERKSRVSRDVSKIYIKWTNIKPHLLFNKPSVFLCSLLARQQFYKSFDTWEKFPVIVRNPTENEPKNSNVGRADKKGSTESEGDKRWGK